MRVPVCVVVVACGIAGQPSQRLQTEPIAQRIISRNMTVNLPLSPCDVPNIVLFAAKDVGVPAGAEFLPVVCASVYNDKGRPPITERIPLMSMRLGEAIELLNKTDPRYHTMDSDGVIVVRPVEAWINNQHFLHTTIEKLEMTDENIGGALDLVVAPFWGGRHPSRAQAMSGYGKLTLSIGPVSVVEALDAIVRIHGAARWSVSYCLPEFAADVATVYLHTYDDHGLGAPFGRQRQINGKPVVCGPQGLP